MTSKQLNSILIANRGEIALRIIRACKELGITSVLAYSEADRGSLPVKLADRAVCIGPASAAKSYQDPRAIISAALAFKVDAIHPGYGFLAENPDFAEMCETEGVGFVGPTSSIIRSMGDKIQAKKIARRAGVPTVPGSDGAIAEHAEAVAVANDVGYPLLIKASAGGGGRGMRVVESAETLERDLSEIMAEAETAFGDRSVYLERYLTDIRHIEIQVVSDGQSTVHLGERDCTAQRRNQKLVEEGPSPVLDEELRKSLADAAVALCQEVGYRNAGTVEFVFDNIERKYYFIEMNTRIQVEHPVSEMITGIDLIKLQLEIAAGNPLPLTQDDIHIRGHAIECRINAEDPSKGFMPRPGRVESFRAPGGFGVRLDTHIETGYVIPPFYDSMIGKLIVWGNDREEAISRALRALQEMQVEGVTTTAGFQASILDSGVFRSGDFNTAFVAKFLESQAASDL
ncbi:acetyl-CoA carboxylase biotin carboxylase subunit [Arthrobacter sp. zg-Y826]|uniref:acetyl-CoA carboxylase biotin carboxylase subunit n=1 Tax=Arthrobacter jinronghuae TaxID=2964609 RepID=UPI0021031832|nr:acetyl-CoA carboxylase biotin carboxylase subunit [Arthrobacter jinronghuae]MCQ1957870.1 acetyl-CoA carboxylase biotin carboxylase subunit [Arthrobacter jinronghuae]